MIVKTRTMRWPVFEDIRFALSRDLRGIGSTLMKNWLILLVCLWASQASAQGTYTATSCSQAAVAAAIASEQANPKDGDIISIPSGTCTWSSSSALSQTFANSVTIQGQGAVSATSGGSSTAGTDNTVIIDNTTSSDDMMAFTTTAGKSFRFTGLAIEQNGSSNAKNNAVVEIAGTSTSVRVDHCHFHAVSAYLVRFDGPYGVMDHDYFDVTGNNPGGIKIYQTGNGDASWNQADKWGTANFMYVEDSQFNGQNLGDSSGGGRYVFRHNTMQSSSQTGIFMANHGTTDSRGRSMRAAEFYLNTFSETFICGSGCQGVNQPTQANNGGGTLYWGNTVTGYRDVITFDYTRKDNGTYNYGAPPTGWGNCNGAGTFTAWDGPSPGYPCLDQGARGAGDLLSGNLSNGTVCDITTFLSGCSVFTGSFVHQALSPVYVWNNTFTPATGFSNPALISSISLYKDNQDYYQQFGTYGEPGSFDGTKGVGQGLLSARPATCTAGPGGNTPGVGYWATDTTTLYVCNPTNTWTSYYRPYTYPHPLANGGSTTVNPPTNLAATVQ